MLGHSSYGEGTTELAQRTLDIQSRYACCNSLKDAVQLLNGGVLMACTQIPPCYKPSSQRPPSELQQRQQKRLLASYLFMCMPLRFLREQRAHV